jgi:hypothetical protein
MIDGVPVPLSAGIAIRFDVVYAIVESAEGVPMVKRYRVVPPDTQ